MYGLLKMKECIVSHIFPIFANGPSQYRACTYSAILFLLIIKTVCIKNIWGPLSSFMPKFCVDVVCLCVNLSYNLQSANMILFILGTSLPH